MMKELKPTKFMLWCFLCPTFEGQQASDVGWGEGLEDTCLEDS